MLNATTGPPLTAATLATGTHGKYDAVFLDLGGLETSGGSAFTDAEWTTLATYEAEFSVRRVSLYTSPSTAYGLSDNGDIDPTQDAHHDDLHRGRDGALRRGRTARTRSS